MTQSPRGLAATVLVGELGGQTSPAHVCTVCADIVVDAGSRTTLPLDPRLEHAVLILGSTVTVDGTELGAGPLLYLGAGRDHLATACPGGVRVLLIGGEPCADDFIIWWNFVGRSHDEIVQARRDWEDDGTACCRHVLGHGDERIPRPRCRTSA